MGFWDRWRLWLKLHPAFGPHHWFSCPYTSGKLSWRQGCLWKSAHILVSALQYLRVSHVRVHEWCCALWYVDRGCLGLTLRAIPGLPEKYSQLLLRPVLWHLHSKGLTRTSFPKVVIIWIGRAQRCGLHWYTYDFNSWIEWDWHLRRHADHTTATKQYAANRVLLLSHSLAVSHQQVWSWWIAWKTDLFHRRRALNW